VIGAGSVGSQVADSLVRNGIRHFTIVDPDVVTAPNLSRSVYRLSDVGRPKVASLAEHLCAVGGPQVQVITIQDDVCSVLDASGPIAGLDLVVLATDDIAAELRVNQACYGAGIAMVSVKLYKGARAGELAWVAPHLGSPCLSCLIVGRSGRLERGTDYGTGRLVAEAGLGTDIAVVVPQGGKTVLALLAYRDSPSPGGDAVPDSELAQWFDHLASRGKVMAITANVPGWQLFAEMSDPLWNDPWATVWVRAGRRPDCLVCGPAG
jgi:hypothetical protein